MSYQHFTKHERNEISVLLNKGYSQSDIAKALGRDPSSMSREIKNNSVKGQYDPNKAELKARKRRLYAKYQGMKIRQNNWLEKYVQENIKAGWTPEEIAGRLKTENDNQTVISFKAIYQYLETPFGYPYQRYLPHKYHCKRHHTGCRKKSLTDRVFIDQRPNIINERVRIGDFEGDTLGAVKSDKTRLAALTDRKSRYFLVKKVSRLKETINGFKELLADNDKAYSLTLDNGPENDHWQQLNLNTYFCHPYSSWEKGTIENTFQRLRRFIPKKTKLNNYPEEQICAIVKQMNNTPRKCLNYFTPEEVFKGYFKKTINLGCCT